MQGAKKMKSEWIVLFGELGISDSALSYQGGEAPDGRGGVTVKVAMAVNTKPFSGGYICADLTFATPFQSDLGNAGIVLHRNPATEEFLMVQFGGPSLVSIWLYVGNKQPAPNTSPWTMLSSIGTAAGLEPGRTYKIEVNVQGSNTTVKMDGAAMLQTTLPAAVPSGNTGVMLRGKTDIVVSNFTIKTVRPKVFVVMQFSSPFNELFEDVLKPVCDSLGLEAYLANDTYGPGLIISDIERQIIEARIVVADITPKNMNVYFEVGYAHALKKDTLLIAGKTDELPFDVSPFRVLFYEDSIAGKKKVEAGLRKHLEAIIGKS
jgi:hypothetical protein